jgi:hypothetical protein
LAVRNANLLSKNVYEKEKKLCLKKLFKEMESPAWEVWIAKRIWNHLLE